jgi:hypothetical protein
MKVLIYFSDGHIEVQDNVTRIEEDAWDGLRIARSFEDERKHGRGDVVKIEAILD